MNEQKGEFAFIDWIRKRARTDADNITLGPGDDMAIVNLAAEAGCLLTVDALLEGTHFDLATDSLQDVGRKALAVSLSDVAAMAALPLAALAWVSLPDHADMDFAKAIYRGLQSCAEKFNCPIVGGDVTSWPSGKGKLALGTAVIAQEAGIKAVRRSGAKTGDIICVTGSLGGSRLGKHLTFQPRVQEARMLAKAAPIHAMIDISDGLSSDLRHICTESRVAAEVRAADVPVSPAAEEFAKSTGRPPLEHALNDGEDFELLFTIAEDDLHRLPDLSDFGASVQNIGRITEGRGMKLLMPDGTSEPLEPAGWEHPLGARG
ncbi:MAG: thiamine-phosphate kinase [Planctomycetia bacterium]|nr:thiamine-phosphate kinase [Planctomycetia bacterium]